MSETTAIPLTPGSISSQPLNQTTWNNMNSKLIIAADRGLLRAYRQTQNATDRQPHLELIAELKPAAAHIKLSDQVSDQAGRFPRGGGKGATPGDLSAGEQLHQEAEQDHRLIEQLAEKIDALLADSHVIDCSLAVSAPIHKQLFNALQPTTRDKISQVLASNLAKTDPTELLGHFAKAARSSVTSS